MSSAASFFYAGLKMPERDDMPIVPYGERLSEILLHRSFPYIQPLHIAILLRREDVLVTSAARFFHARQERLENADMPTVPYEERLCAICLHKS